MIVTAPVFVHNVLFGWLDLFNAELSPKRQWRELRSQEVGEEGKLHLKLPCHHTE